MKNEANGFLLMNNCQDKKATPVGKNLLNVNKKDFISVFYGVILNSLLANLKKKTRLEIIDLINQMRMEFIHEARIPINYLLIQSSIR